jgi:hypothetical protein
MLALGDALRSHRGTLFGVVAHFLADWAVALHYLR